MNNNAPDYKDNLLFEPLTMPYCDVKELKDEIQSLRNLLKECKNIVVSHLWAKAEFSDGQTVEKDDLLTRINAAIGGSEDK